VFNKRFAILSLLAGQLLFVQPGPAWSQAERVQDPTRPAVVARSEVGAPLTADSLHLTGVLVSSSRRIAVIDGKFYRVGDRVNGEEIMRIEPGSIQIRRGSEQVLVRVRNVNTDGNDVKQD
jgi:hypothetical protein